MKYKLPIRNLVFVALGICLFMLKTVYNGPYKEIFISYWGNIWVSFSVYFLVGISNKYWKKNDFTTAFISIFILELFEVTNGFFHLFANVYDPVDLVFNIWGVIFGITLEIALNIISIIKQEKRARAARLAMKNNSN